MLIPGIIAAVVSIGGVLVWIGLLLWAARADGRDQEAYERTHGLRPRR